MEDDYRINKSNMVHQQNRWPNFWEVLQSLNLIDLYEQFERDCP
jgi:hypothetical protein